MNSFAYLWQSSILSKLSFKAQVHSACIAQIGERIRNFHETLADLSDGAKNDAKSTAGDKHETANAMMQLEREKISRQLLETLDQYAILQRLENHISSTKIGFGSLIKTNRGYIYLSIPMGKLLIDTETMMVISPKSPLGVKLIGLSQRNSAEINGTVYVVEEVW